jgi:hypothetical protein
VAKPMPCPEPVTIAVFPVRSICRICVSEFAILFIYLISVGCDLALMLVSQFQISNRQFLN